MTDCLKYNYTVGGLVFLENVAKPKIKDENFYFSDQPAEIKETTDEVIYEFVVMFM